ncbi:hypothetical protein ES288_D05G013800v1 [Gossypium darwinii]|nr:hypothetical protein ES288_D05G013800v1 [Gossypium darwinii]
MQQEISKIQEEFAHLEAKLDSQLQEFKTAVRGDLQSLLVQYFGPPPTGSSVTAAADKGKGVLGAPPGFLPKTTDLLPGQTEPFVPDGGSVHVRDPSYVAGVFTRTSRLECPKFDGNDFRGWWTKLEQYFEAEGIPEVSKVRMVMLNLEGRALEWRHFYSQRQGGLQMLLWPAYIKSLQDRFGCGPFRDPMRELVNLKQQCSISSLKSNNVGVVANTLHYGALNTSIGATATVSSGIGCLDTGRFMYQKGATLGALLENGQIENWADSGLADNSQ